MLPPRSAVRVPRHPESDRDLEVQLAALLRHLAEGEEWQERALCAQTDPEAFFPEKGGSTAQAKQVCLACPVRAECLDYALRHNEGFGVWGGLSEPERRKLRRRTVAA